MAMERYNDDLKAYRVGSIGEAMKVAHQRAREIPDEDPDPYGYAQEMENNLGVDILAPHWKTKPDDELWLKRVKARAKKEAVMRFLIQGFKVPEIARKCKLSESTVIKYIGDVQNEWRRTYLDDAELFAARDMERLDYYLMRLAKKIDEGDIKAISTATEIVRVRANILGYAQGVQIDVEAHVREAAASAGFDPEKAVALAARISINYKP